MNKSIISWVGGKAKLMWLINLLAPPKYDRSIDVFGGSGTVTLNLDCPHNKMRVYNDFNGNLVNLMRCARERPLALIRELGFLTLNSRDDFEVFKKFINQEEFTEADNRRELELTEIMFEPPTAKQLKRLLRKRGKELGVKRAATYYKLLRYSFNSNGDTYGGKRCDLRRFFDDIWQFSSLFKDVIIENKDFEALIRQYDRETAFIYCDPPYYEAEGFYAVVFTEDDHKRLHDTLAGASGKVMVSYNNAPQIVKLYQDFYIFYTTRPNSMSKKEGDVYEELILTNYDPREFLPEKTGQLNLFSFLLNAVSEGEYKLIHEPKIKTNQEEAT
ncbi:DNA adenine methylase [Bengtsoniella intestinalis]|uniref:DNA adenine methylase n=1 Tax=Bengtsoniella intestinalis TaxID=3073143 RepID=UPI00391EF40D